MSSREYDRLKAMADELRRSQALDGMCLQLTAGAFTRDDLLARGLSADAADELMAFSARLMAKHAASQSRATDATP